MKMERKQRKTRANGNDSSQIASWFGRRSKKTMKGAQTFVVPLAVLAGFLTQVVRAQSAYSLVHYGLGLWRPFTLRRRELKWRQPSPIF